MANEDLKLNKIQLGSAQTTLTTSVSGQTSQTTADNIFKAFELFAKNRGVTIKVEDFQRVVNAHPEVFNLPVNQQAEAIVKLLTQPKAEQSTAGTVAAPTAVEPQPQNPASGTLSEDTQKQLFGAIIASLSEEELDTSIEALTEAAESLDGERQAKIMLDRILSMEDPEQQGNQTRVPETTPENGTPASTNFFAAQSQSTGSTEATASTPSTPTAPATSSAETPASTNFFAAQSQSTSSTGTTATTATTTSTEATEATATEQETESSKPTSKSATDVETSRAAKLNEDEEKWDGSLRDYYDTASFSKMNLKDQQKAIIEEYAVNKFLYGGEKPKSTKEWNNLSDEEKQKYIKSCEAEALQYINLDINDKNISAKDKSLNLQMKMLAILAANDGGDNGPMSVAKLNSLPQAQQSDIIGKHLYIKIAATPEKMSAVENSIYEKYNFVLKAVQKELESKGIQAEICEGADIKYYTTGENKQVSLGLSIKHALEEIPDENKTEEQKALSAFLDKVNPKYLEEFGSLYGSNSNLANEIINSEEYSQKYNQASNDRERAAVKMEYFYETYKDDPDFGTKLHEYVTSAIKAGDTAELYAYYSLAQAHPEAAQAMASALGDMLVVNSAFFDKLGEYGITTIEQLRELEQTDPEKAKELSDLAVKASTDDQMLAFKDTFSALQCYQTSTYTAFVGRIYDIEDPDKRDQVIRSCTEEQRIAIASNVDRAGKDRQTSILRTATEGSARVSEEAIRSGVITRMHKDNQVEGFGILQERAETLMERDQAITNLTILTGQIPQCDASNQLAMHESITNGVYEEVAVYAASNIHKYDASVQAEALKTSYATGKVAVIEAATLQVSKMDQNAVASMRKEINTQIIAMEERHSLSMIEEYALRQLKKQLGFDVDTRTPEFRSQFERYVAELKSLPKSELYRRLCNDMQSWPADMQVMFLEAIVRYCPELFQMMLDKFGIKLLTNFGQVNSATKNNILMHMLKTPSMRSEAIAYMKANPNGSYSDELKQLFDETIEDLIANGTMVEDTTTQPMSRTFKSEPTQTSAQSLADIGQKYNWNMTSDIDGNIGLVS
ncbi:hypothetical protein IKP85_02015 [bacterium]|nr:hypothetical protein [bacterium]